MKRLICTLVVLALAAGCSSMRISMDYAEAADFTSFKTFQFKETEDAMVEGNQLSHQRIVDAITREMNGQGFAEVDSDPDVYVSYYAKVNEQVIVNTTHMGYMWGPSWRWHSSAFGSHTTVITYDRGTIVIDIWEASEKLLVWRGIVEDVLRDNPARVADSIDRGIRRVFGRFPPPSSR